METLGIIIIILVLAFLASVAFIVKEFMTYDGKDYEDITTGGQDDDLYLNDYLDETESYDI